MPKIVYPSPFKEREKVDSKLGIKSALDELRSVVATVYLLYIASNKQSFINYSEEYSERGVTKIRFTNEVITSISTYLGKSRTEIESVLRANKLIDNQYEPLYVGITLFFKLADLKKTSSGSERTGGFRFNKQLNFSSNIILLDLLISSMPENSAKTSIFQWLNNRTATDSLFENKIKNVLSVFAQPTLLKARMNSSEDIIFQMVGVYEQIVNGYSVSLKGEQEIVGPNRILSSFFNEGLDPFVIKGQGGSYTSDNIDDLSEYYKIIENSLNINNVDYRIGTFQSQSNEGFSHPSLPTSLTATSISSFNQQLLSAIRTKPFVLLAGISGTGKSRIVRELAKACWSAGDENRTGHKPMNYKMIQVRPNWHDSSEILGYVSRIDGEEFVVGPFLQAIVEAWKDTGRPYFVCLDEMNLAPVEQYFAEYLSVFESREFDGEHYVTDPIMEKQVEQWYIDMVQKLVPDDEVLRNQFLTQGISIPENLVVIGTVNMDETTYSFSRKVLDRAMTLEMNDVTLEAGINGNPLENDFSDVLISAGDVFGRPKKMSEILAENVGVSESVVSYLKKINEILAETPFRIAFRTRNEAILYVLNKLELMSPLDGYDESVELSNALDEITMMKILSRIEGDQSKVSADKLNNLKANVGTKSKAKLDYMIKKLNNVGFTSFWE